MPGSGVLATKESFDLLDRSFLNTFTFGYGITDRFQAGTPRANYAGCTQYFCSNRCRTEFVKAPERFVARKK